MRRRALYLYEAIPTGHHPNRLRESRDTLAAGPALRARPSMVTGTSSGTVHSLPLDLAVMLRRTGAFA